MKGKVITASIISQSGMTKRLVLFDQLLTIHYSLFIIHPATQYVQYFSSVRSATHYSLLITHYEGYRRLQQLLLLLRAVIPARPPGETGRGAEQ